MTVTLWHVANDKMTNITPLIGSISWQSHINQLGQQLNFNKAFNDDRFFPKINIETGDLIVLQGKEEIFRGTVLLDERSGRSPIAYTCFDPAFNLNKSKDIFQFNKEKADKVIVKMLSEYDVPIGNIVSIPVEIDKIFTNIISDNIKEILDIAHKKTGTKYRMEMRAGKLYIEKQTDLVIKGIFKLVSNGSETDVQASISNPSRKLSIENMKNRIKIVSGEKVVATVESDSLIDKYGLLTEVQTIDEKEKPEAKSIAQNLLHELGKVFEESSLQMLGDEKVRAGRIMSIEEPLTGMKGQYLVNSVTHSVANGVHKMFLNLGAM